MTEAATERYVEVCVRCGAEMEWRHGTFQCPRCRFKIGCCEGETGDCRPDTRPSSGNASVFGSV